MRPAAVLAGLILLATGGTPAAADPPAGVPAASSPLAARAVWLVPADTLVAAPAGPADPWLGQDKLLHFGASLTITLSTQYVLVSRMGLPERNAWPVAAGTALSMGLFKELADSQRPRQPLFSWRDMAWNAAGVGTALLVILL